MLCYTLASLSLTVLGAPNADEASVTLQVNTLKLIWSDVEANAVGSPKRQEYLKEFLQKSAPALRDIPTNHPAAGGLWTLRAISAYELDEKEPAVAAGIKMQELEVDKSPSELVQRTLAMLNRKGWLKSLREIANEKATEEAAELRRKAAELEATRLRREEERKVAKAKEEAEHKRLDTEKVILALAEGNSLGMKFQPVAGRKLLFSVWEVRVQDYQAFVKFSGRKWEKPEFHQEANHPAVNVSWDDAEAFCQWLSSREGKSYRLPTDEEWSWAVGIGDRENGSAPKDKDAGLPSEYPWGTSWPPPLASGNYDASLHLDAYEYTCPVGTFPANELGLYDLEGNVREWCEDLYDPDRKGRHVIRGGAWLMKTKATMLSSWRESGDDGFQSSTVGFRVVVIP